MRFAEILDEANHVNTRNKPFTKGELLRLEKVFGVFARRGITDLSAKFFGFKGEIIDLSDSIQDEAKTGEMFAKKAKVMSLTVDQLYAQDQGGVSVENMREVLTHWGSAPLPEALKLSNGSYFLLEGHHRVALQVLAGRKEIKLYVRY